MTEQPDLSRRGALRCMTWAGAAMLWTVPGGIPRARLAGTAQAAETGFSFVQVSDSHIGFNRAANPDTPGTLARAMEQVRAMPGAPAFMIHTGDITHLSKPAEFDTAAALLGTARLPLHTVPGEHDLLENDRRSWLDRFGKNTQGDGWYSFDAGGVHFIGLVNVMELKDNGLGNLGAAQLDWLARDVQGLSASTPIVVFAHVPLWIVYRDWGWGTADGEQALALLRRFGSVTVLNGHIHQTMQKIEGNVAFHIATSTAFPQPAPGTAPSPGPLTVPADRLRGLLGVRQVSLVSANAPLAVIDTPLV